MHNHNRVDVSTRARLRLFERARQCIADCRIGDADNRFGFGRTRRIAVVNPGKGSIGTRY
jgi:hypothetical protein